MRFPPVAQACKALRWPSKRRGPNRNSLMDAFTPPPACSSSPFFLLFLLATSIEVRQYLTCTKSVRPVFCLAFFSPVPLSKPLVHCQRMCSLSLSTGLPRSRRLPATLGSHGMSANSCRFNRKPRKPCGPKLQSSLGTTLEFLVMGPW